MGRTLSRAVLASASGVVWGLAPGSGLAAAQAASGNASVQCFGSSTCPQTVPVPPIELPPVLANNGVGAAVNDSITAVERQTLQQVMSGAFASSDASALLGKLVIYDRNLSPNRLEACASCHTKEAGFTGGVSLYNLTAVDFPGTVFYRGGPRKPNSYAYAPFAPVLHYDAARGEFVGGNFWDDRATGMVTGNPAGDQALNPPLDPLEMAMPDSACVVYRISTGAYRTLFEKVWGARAFAINWPADTADKCSQPASIEASNPTLPTFNSNVPATVVGLGAVDRAAATQTFHQMGLSTAAYEASTEVSAFTSKFDYVLQGKAALTQQEQLGYSLFTGQGHCSQCHDASGPRPLFTDFTTANLGLPHNPAIPFYDLNRKDQYGFVVNPAGPDYRDPGLGGYLASPSDTNPDWQRLASNFVGRFQVATLRNVAKHPGGPEFFKAFMHNGYFKNLKDVVHFYNTRDVLPTCGPEGQDGLNPPVGVTCWPAPELAQNENRTQVGNLGLSNGDEDAIVAFMGTLSDGYNPGGGQ